MGILLRKLKAVLGIGSIWGIAAGAVGTALGGLSSLPTGSFLSSALFSGVGAGVAAFVLGVGFGGLLSVMEGRRTLDELTAHRAALWGFVVGVGSRNRFAGEGEPFGAAVEIKCVGAGPPGH